MQGSSSSLVDAAEQSTDVGLTLGGLGGLGGQPGANPSGNPFGAGILGTPRTAASAAPGGGGGFLKQSTLGM